MSSSIHSLERTDADDCTKRRKLYSSSVSYPVASAATNFLAMLPLVLQFLGRYVDCITLQLVCKAWHKEVVDPRICSSLVFTQHCCIDHLRPYIKKMEVTQSSCTMLYSQTLPESVTYLKYILDRHCICISELYPIEPLSSLKHLVLVERRKVCCGKSMYTSGRYSVAICPSIPPSLVKLELHLSCCRSFPLNAGCIYVPPDSKFEELTIRISHSYIHSIGFIARVEFWLKNLTPLVKRLTLPPVGNFDFEKSKWILFKTLQRLVWRNVDHFNYHIKEIADHTAIVQLDVSFARYRLWQQRIEENPVDIPNVMLVRTLEVVKLLHRDFEIPTGCAKLRYGKPIIWVSCRCATILGYDTLSLEDKSVNIILRTTRLGPDQDEFIEKHREFIEATDENTDCTFIEQHENLLKQKIRLYEQQTCFLVPP